MIWYFTIGFITFVYEKVKHKLICKFIHHNGTKLIKYYPDWHANEGLVLLDWVLL